MTTTPTTCPYLKQVVMLYCDACPMKKMVPLDHLVSASPCLAQSYEQCSLYREVTPRLKTSVTEPEPPLTVAADSRREVFP
jgi:hypothetical protein